MAVTKSDVFANDTTGMENKTVIVTTILVNITACYCIPKYKLLQLCYLCGVKSLQKHFSMPDYDCSNFSSPIVAPVVAPIVHESCVHIDNQNNTRQLISFHKDVRCFRPVPLLYS